MRKVKLTRQQLMENILARIDKRPKPYSRRRKGAYFTRRELIAIIALLDTADRVVKYS